MILSTIFSLLISGSNYIDDPYLVGWKDRVPFVFEGEIADLDEWNNTLYLTKEAANAYHQMKSAALRDGIYLQLIFGFRTHSQQKKARRDSGKLAALPGTSPHERGIAIDFSNMTTKNKTYWWLIKNSEKFGFYNTIRKEFWHFEFKKELSQ